MMKITATAATPYRTVELTPVDAAVWVTVVAEPETVIVDPPLTVVVCTAVEVVVTAPPATLLVLVTVGPETVDVTVVDPALDGTFCKVKATRSPGTDVPHVTWPASIGKMTSIWPPAVAPMAGRTLRGPPM